MRDGEGLVTAALEDDGAVEDEVEEKMDQI